VRPARLDVEDRRDFRVRAAGTTLTGWYGVRTEPAAEAGFRLYRLGRLIVSGEFFGHPVPAQAPSLGRLVGELEVPKVQLTMNKSDFDRDSQTWIEIERRMHQLIGPAVRRLLRGEQPRPSPAALRAAEQARRLLSQALRLMDRPDLFPGFQSGSEGGPEGLGGAPESGTEQLPLDDSPPGEDTGSSESAAPRAPQGPAPPAQPGARRRRGFGEIVIRPLEPSIRSEAVLEDGVRKVVINSNHPLFKERRGDTWYQLETAAREICRDAEPSNVMEFERRVNQIVLTAFKLKTRPRRRRPGGKQLALPGPY
jgi:hypothetical protein